MFILESTPKQIDISIEEISDIESRLNKGITKEEANTFLDYLVYITRERLDSDFNNASYKNMCNRAQAMIHYYLHNLNITHYLHNSAREISPNGVRHFFVVALLNIEGEDMPYIIDPTYRQFFEYERCKKNKDVPGNFITNTTIIKDFLVNGYMVASDENIEEYCNSLYLTDKNALGKIPGKIFKKVLFKNTNDVTKTKEELLEEGLYIDMIKSQNKHK